MNRLLLPAIRTRRTRGFTITEMLVAAAIMTILGMGVIVIMRDTIGIWRDHETLRDEYDRATAVMLQIEQDLNNLATDVAREPGWLAGVNGETQMRPPRQRLIIGTDALNRPFIVFTRQLKDEMGNAITRNSGMASSTTTPNYLTPYGSMEDLRALGNLCEVAYAFGPAPRYLIHTADGQEFVGEYFAAEALSDLGLDGTEMGAWATSGGLVPLGAAGTPEEIQKAVAGPDAGVQPEFDARIKYAGVGFYRASIGPPPTPYLDRTGYGYGSLFADFDAAALGFFADRLQSEGIAGMQAALIPSWLQKYQLMSEGVLYVGYQLLNYDTDTEQYFWTPSEFDVANVDTPFFYDSAAGYNPTSGSRGQPFPNSIRITVTVEALSGKPTQSQLSRPLTPGTNEVYLKDAWALPSAEGTHPFVLIGKGTNGQDYEWVWFESASGTRLNGVHRGTRGTPEFSGTFPAGTPVRWGMTLQKIVQIRVTDAPNPGAVAPGAPVGIGPTGWSFNEQARFRDGYQRSYFPRQMPGNLLNKGD